MSLLDPAVTRQTGGVGEDGGAQRGRQEGLKDEYRRAAGLAATAGAGAAWGLLGYSVLWQGGPFGVNGRFGGSEVGAVVLRPAGTVLSGVPLRVRWAC